MSNPFNQVDPQTLRLTLRLMEQVRKQEELERVARGGLSKREYDRLAEVAELSKRLGL